MAIAEQIIGDKVIIFVKSIYHRHLKKRIYAYQYGKEAFRLEIPIEKHREYIKRKEAKAKSKRHKKDPGPSSDPIPVKGRKRKSKGGKEK